MGDLLATAAPTLMRELGALEAELDRATLASRVTACLAADQPDTETT
jgi:hypothetical protein